MQYNTQTSTSYLPKLKVEARLPGDKIKIFDETLPFPRGETIISPPTLFREGGRSSVP